MKINADEFSERLWDHAAAIARFVDTIPETRVGRHVVGQLPRCGTAAGPNYDEACVAESRRDFTHKISIAAKEMRETLGWVRFCGKTKRAGITEIEDLVDECRQLLRMLAKSAQTSRGRIEGDRETPMTSE